jgi:hypothetical protein
MINLLPPDIKEQVRYAKLNRAALSYVRGIVAVVVVLAGVFAGALIYLNVQSQAVAKDVAQKKDDIKVFTTTFLPKAKDASDRLDAIKYVQSTQMRFSLVVADIAKILPQGVSIDSTVLTGDDKKPITLAVTGDTYDTILAFRNALLTSPRISGADIISISKQAKETGPSSWSANLTVGFKPGQAK